MALSETFSNFTLTVGQSKLIDELDQFLNDDSSCFLLKGYAGTGKTFLMKGLTDFLLQTGRSFVIAAPTGRAAKVISQKTKQKAYTIHRTIYSSKDLKEFKIKEVDGSETFKFYFDIRKNEDPVNTVYIIDESSMISNVYSEGEFFRFGSGMLLKDLVNYINFDNNHYQKKIIFIGDNAQLPPVNMNFSPALNIKYLEDNCGIISREFELTEVVRQKAESGILYNATQIRKALKENIFNKLDIKTNFADIYKTSYDEILPKYLEGCNNKIDEETIIITHSNSAAKGYNDFVRNHFFPNQKTIAIGDKVILLNNNYNYPQMELLNGDIGFVKDISPTTENRNIELKRKNKQNVIERINVQLTFRNVEITFTDEEFIKHNIKCKIIENLLYSTRRDLSSDELKALYIDFKIRNKELKSGTQPFKDALRSDLYFNALRIKFGYAITCHKAQGGEWTNTFLNCKTSMGYFNPSYFRWLYTGITRAKENLFTIDEPHFNIADNLQIPVIHNFQPKEDKIQVSSAPNEDSLPFNLENESDFLKQLYFLISDKVKLENITIADVRHTAYLEHYTFAQANDLAIFKIHYNGQNLISNITKPGISTEFSNNIHIILSTIIGKRFQIEADVPKASFEFEEQFLKEFYDSLREKLDSCDFQIVTIEHKPYHEIYEITKDGLIATYKFWYDGNFRFKKTEIISTRTTGLINEINELLLTNSTV